MTGQVRNLKHTSKLENQGFTTIWDYTNRTEVQIDPEGLIYEDTDVDTCM
jgi:hypothetical protein